MTRFIEIDILRGVAVISMVIFHYFYMIYLMGDSDTAITNNLVICLAIFAHITFIILFGINLALSFQKNRETGNKDEVYYDKQFR